MDRILDGVRLPGGPDLGRRERNGPSGASGYDATGRAT